MKGRQPKRGPSLLYIIRQIYDSPKLVPILPYDNDALFSKRLKDLYEGGDRTAELHRILAQFDPGQTHEELADRAEEMIFLATLLTFGTGRPNRKPRLDFFLMHILTSSIYIPSYFKAISNIQYKRDLLRAYIQVLGVLIMIRGRPRIDAKLLMSYTDNPNPPNSNLKNTTAQPNAIGVEDVNPWNAIVAEAIHSPDSHVLKSLRSLIYGAENYGSLGKGELIGTYGPDGKETHTGIAEVDGSVFIRAAGMMMDTLGWLTYGQKSGDWDRSALGWDDAWKNED